MQEFSYVYVLVSNATDIYCEQTLLSAISLRKHMPHANIILLTDDETEASLIGNRSKIKDVVNKIISIHVPNFNNLQKSRFLKTNMPEYVLNDFLYIDSDTIIVAPLDDIEKCEIEIGAVLDRHVVFSESPAKHIIVGNGEKMGFTVACNDKHFNGGVMLFRRNPKTLDFFKKWHQLWLETNEKGFSFDQIALAQANFLTGGILQELSGIWNCQVENGIKYFSSAKILHFFASTSKKSCSHVLMQKKFYEKIKEEGISEEIMDVVDHPGFYFTNKTQIIAEDYVDFFNTPLIRLFYRLFSQKKTKNIFCLINSLLKKVQCKSMGKITKSMSKKNNLSSKR